MPEQDFEKAFATLAYSELEQKAPGLFPYLIGFQLVEKNDEDTNALGIFGFKVGDQWYYSPVFWLNGRVKGYDLLYIVSQDLFIPLSEAWINYVTNRKPYVMGESEERTPQQLGVSAPDFNIFRKSPLSKTSAAKPKMTTTPEGMFKKVGHSRDLPDVLKELPPQYVHGLLKSMDGNTKFAEATLKFYSAKSITDAVRTVANQTSGTNIFKQAATDENEHFVSSDKADKVDILYGTNDFGTDSFTPQTTMEKEKQMSGEPVIRDDRLPKDTSEVYSTTEYEQVFQNPSRSGLWDILLSDGSTTRALIDTNPTTFGRNKNVPFASVVAIDDKKFINASLSVIFAKNELAPDVWKPIYEGAASLSSLSVGDYGVLLDENFNMSIPFRVNEIIKGTSGDTTIGVDTESSITRPTRQNSEDYEEPAIGSTGCNDTYISYSSSGCDAPCEVGGSDSTLKVMKGPARMTDIRRLALVGNERTKFLKLGTARKPANNGGEYKSDPWYDTKSKNRIQLGTFEDIDYKLRKLGMHKLAVTYDGNSEVGFRYDNRSYRRMGVGEATARMIEKTGMVEADAITILDNVRKNNKATYLVKKAIVNFSEATPTYDENYKAPVQTEKSDSDIIPSDTVDRYEAFEVDDEMQQTAQRAADMGQKEVFDTSVMSGMAKSNKIEDHMSQFVKDIIVGNDRIGRILFMYYMHFDQFADRYGDEDLGELEDLLRESFERNGEVVLFLKKKSVEPDAIASESVVAL